MLGRTIESWKVGVGKAKFGSLVQLKVEKEYCISLYICIPHFLEIMNITYFHVNVE